MGVLVAFIAWVTFNLALVLPYGLFLFHTVNSVFPVLAAVEDIDAPIYEPLELGLAVEPGAEELARRDNKASRKPRAVSSSIRDLTRLLYSSRKCFSLLRGFGWLFLWNLAKGLVALTTTKLPSILGFLAQILLPLALIQLHVLWVHTVIAKSNSRSFGSRLISTKTAFKAVTLPMLLVLTAEATTQRVLKLAYQSMGMKWEDFLPTIGTAGNALKFWLLLVVLVTVLVLPTHMLLVRVEASLLSANEHTIVPLDPALAAGQRGRVNITLSEAWTTLSWTSLGNLAFLYLRIFLITAISVALIGFLDFTWYIIMALQTWGF